MATKRNTVVELPGGRVLTGEAAANYGKSTSSGAFKSGDGSSISYNKGQISGGSGGAAAPTPKSEPTILSSGSERTAFKDNSLFVNDLVNQFPKDAYGSPVVSQAGATTKKKPGAPAGAGGKSRQTLDSESEFEDPEIRAVATQRLKIEKEIESINSQLDRSRKYLRASQQRQVESIKDIFASRIQQMEDINKRSEGELKQFGIATSANQRSASFIGIVSAEERSGLQKITDLESERESLVSEAETAIAEKDFELLADRRSQLDKNLERADAELRDLQKIAREEDKKAEDAKIQASRDAAVADLVTQGVTDPSELLRLLNYDDEGNQIGDISAEELQSTLAALKPTGLLDFTEIMKDVAKNGAPPEIIDAIGAAKTIGAAVKAAGVYLQDAPSYSGKVGEYLFYKKQAEAAGQLPVDFETYQNRDANRKALATAVANGNGLTPAQTANYLRITDKYQADSIIKLTDSSASMIGIADQVIADPNKATNQLKALYVLVKNLDPDSAVREGELALANSTQSYLQNFQTSLSRLQKGQVIAPQAAKDLAEATKEIASVWQKTAEQRTKRYVSQASNADPAVGKAFDKYLSDYGNSINVGQEIIDTEEEALEALSTFKISNPDKASEIDGRVKTMEEQLGRPIGAYDFLQAFPEYGLQSFNSVGGDTNIASKLTDAIMAHESGGKQVAGKSGEFGAFQFLPQTWQIVSKQLFKKVLPQTFENEIKVAKAKVQQLLGKGYTPREVALIWNTSLGGSEKPLVKRGVNAQGVTYDSKAYADAVMRKLRTV